MRLPVIVPVTNSH